MPTRRAEPTQVARSPDDLLETMLSITRRIEGFLYRCNNDRDYSMLHITDGIHRLSGYNPAEFIDNSKRAYSTIVHPDDLDEVYKHVDLALASKAQWEIDYRIVRCDGGSVWVHEVGAGVFNDLGDLLYLEGFVIDITRRKNAETRLHNAIECMENGFAIFDSQDRLAVCNDAYVDPGTRERFGSPVGRTFDEIMQSFASGEFTAMEALKDREGWLRWRSEQHRNPPNRALEIQWTDGRWFSVLERRTSDGGTVGIWTDITDQKIKEFEIEFSKEQLEGQACELATLAEDISHAREQAEAANAAAQQANLEKSRFLASMSHELRTPLNAIIGFSDVMRNELFGPLNPPRYAEYATLISDSGQHLLSLINDVLDLSKVEAGRMTLSIDALSSEALCQQSIGLTRELAARKGVELRGKIEQGLTILHGDQRAVKQILLNLLSNAIKFTESGGSVELEFSRTQEGGIMRVKDSGIGMTPAELKTALEPYGQVDSVLAAKSKGTGLGLPLAKSLAELHGGRLLLTSQKGVGTSIEVMLPWTAGLPVDAVTNEIAATR